jgi:hypothetical protein
MFHLAVLYKKITIKGDYNFMDGMSIFINNAHKATGVSFDKCDVMIRSMVKAVNNGALGGTSEMAALARLKKKRFTTANHCADLVAADTGYDREECKKVCTWMVDAMVQTTNQGGMPALIRMVNLMKKGRDSETKPVDYTDEIKDINDMMDNHKKEQNK